MDKRINIRFFDPDINFIGEITDYTALIHVSKWKSYGDFEIHSSVMYDRLFHDGNIIMLDNDTRKTGIIKYIGVDDEEGGTVELKGFSLLHMLTQRITVPPKGKAHHEFNKAAAEDIMTALVNTNAVAPADSKRKIPKLVIKQSAGRGDRLTYQTRYDVLTDCLEELCGASGLGVCVSLDPWKKQFVFEVLEGVDRTVNQADRPPMIFNVNYDNIENREYIRDSSEYKNCAYTGGQGDGVNRVIKIIGNEKTGLDRYELFVDARDVEDEANLPDRAKVKLAECEKISSYTCEADAALYQKKWNLGDVVTTKDAEWSLLLHERITEVMETLDSDGYVVEPTFGTATKSIIEKVNAVSGDTAKNENIPGPEGKQGPQGYSIQYRWDGTKLGVKREDEGTYKYTNLQGPAGKDGQDGKDGMSVTYTHTQISAQAVWQIAHNLNKYPSVTVVDSAGSVVVGDIRYIDRNNLTVTVTAGFAGKAYLN